MLTLHYLNDSRAQRILWLLEELDVEYELVSYERNRKTLVAPKRLREIHPLGKAPVIEETGGRVIAESGAIVEHLIERYADEDSPLVVPEQGSDAHRRYRYWMHYAEGSGMLYLVLKLIFGELVRQSPLIAKPVMKGVEAAMHQKLIGPELKRHATFWEEHLREHEWFAGDVMTGADIMMSFPLEAFVSRGGLVDQPGGRTKYASIIAFVDRIHARPAYQRALKKGAAYAYI